MMNVPGHSLPSLTSTGLPLKGPPDHFDGIHPLPAGAMLIPTAGSFPARPLS